MVNELAQGIKDMSLDGHYFSEEDKKYIRTEVATTVGSVMRRAVPDFPTNFFFKKCGVPNPFSLTDLEIKEIVEENWEMITAMYISVKARKCELKRFISYLRGFGIQETNKVISILEGRSDDA